MNYSVFLKYSLYRPTWPNGLLKNSAVNLEQNRSSHSYSYACHDICPTFFALFPRKSIPFMKYSG